MRKWNAEMTISMKGPITEDDMAEDWEHLFNQPPPLEFTDEDVVYFIKASFAEGMYGDDGDLTDISIEEISE